ncbi:MAG: pentapeptide repeat-containing protein [Anaerolineales bacterium]
MKPLIRILARVVLFLLLAGTHILPVKANFDHQELTANPEAEKYIKAELLKDGSVDLIEAFPVATQRVVRGAFIVSLWKDPELQNIPFFKIYNTTILGEIQAEGISIPYNVEFWECTFEGRIEMARAHVQSFNMYNSVVTGTVRMGRLEAAGDLALYNTTYQSAVGLFSANIGGSLLAKDLEFNGTEADSRDTAPFELWKVHVAQTTEFTNALIKGVAKLDDAKFDVDARFDHVTFEKAATFTNLAVGNLADFQYTTFGDNVDFSSSILQRDAKFTGAAFQGNAIFDFISVDRFFDFDQAKLAKDFSFQYSTIGWPYFASTEFNGTVDFEGVQASNEFDFSNASYKSQASPFSVTLAKIDGAVKFENFSAPSGLSLENNQFGDLAISGKDDESFAFISLSSSKVDGDMTLENINTSKFLAEGLSVSNSTTFKHVNITNTMDMSNASIGFFKMDDLFLWPKDPDSFNLRGMTYTDIGLVDHELTDATWDVLLKMVEQSAYSPEAYHTLAQFLTEKGQPEWAAEVELTRKLRERDKILTPWSGAWVWSWFLYIFSGYGQRPVFAFIWSFLVIAVGAIVFRREEDMVILDTSDAKPAYSPVLYSFALFLPYIDLGIASKWDPKPNRRFAGTYKHVHRLMGWVLMPIALLAFGGILG